MLAMADSHDSRVASQQHGMALADLASELGAASPSQGAATRVVGVRQDSRTVEPGDLFVVLRGATVDAARFIPQAIERGAVALLLEPGRHVDVALPCIEVSDVRRAMARAAALVYGQPTKALAVVGITGTNGKTTCAQLICQCLEALGAHAGVIGTLGYRYGDIQLPATHTSPEADEVQRLAAAMRSRGAEQLVMEVSSIALSSDRVAGVCFDVAVFTNLSQDHLDYHGTMQEYGRAKRSLFEAHGAGTAVINVDDPFGLELARDFDGKLVRVSVAGHPAEFRVTAIEQGEHGLRMVVASPEGELEVTAPLIGSHNASNVLCALGAVHALGLSLSGAVAALAQVRPVPGRLERCDDPAHDDIIALVDYAHTPDALRSVLASVRPFASGDLWCVFGCGGDRDAEKRAPMGAAVDEAADRAIITNDNPRSEDPRAIADAVQRGFSQPVRVVLDRREAIEQAVAEAAPGDLVLVAGKGHETYQIVGDTVAPFDDRKELRAALLRRRGRR